MHQCHIHCNIIVSIVIIICILPFKELILLYIYCTHLKTIIICKYLDIEPVYHEVMGVLEHMAHYGKAEGSGVGGQS